jgi:hypothetical protein
MNFPWAKIFRQVVAASLALLLCGAPQLLAQSAQNQPAPTTPQNPDGKAQPPSGSALPQSGDPQQSTPPANQGVEVDPSKGPLQPAAPSSTQLPNAPSTAQPSQPAAPAVQAPQTAQTDQKKNTEPQGTAVAGEARTAGGPASKPAGSAIAPAKQKQVRSLLIKLGLIAAGGAAVGTVYALTRSTSSTPPNATAPGATQAH